MSVLLAAVLAGATAAVLVALPSPGQLRFRDLAQVPDGHVATQRRPRLGDSPTGRLRFGDSAPRGRSPAWHLGPPRRWPWPAVLLAAGVLLVVLGPVVPLLAAAAAVVASRAVAGHRRRQGVVAERAGAVEALGALAAELAAGRTPQSALGAAASVAAGPAAAALRSAAAAAELGGDVPAALTAPSTTSVAPTLRALAACWSVCAASGSGLAAAVQRLEEGLRAEQAQRRAVDGELAGPRATALMLSVLPAAGLLMAGALGADPLHVLLRTPLGVVCLLAGVGLDALGVLWTNRLVSRAGGAA